MLPRWRQGRTSLWIVALYALAMATLGFAHKPVAASGLSPVELAAYALPDGTLPDLCLTGHAGSGEKALADHCDACALSHAPGLAAPSQTILPAPAMRELAFAIDPAGQFRPAPRHGPTSRGPPLA